MLRYWRQSEREALIRRLELAVECGVHKTSADAMQAYNREVPGWWKWDRLAYVRICCAWDRRFLRRVNDVIEDTRDW